MKAHEILALRFERISELLKVCRKNRGLTLEEFEKRYGFSKSGVQRMETGILFDNQQRWIDMLKSIDPTPEETLVMITDVDPINDLTADEIQFVRRFRKLTKKDQEWICQTLDILPKVGKRD